MSANGNLLPFIFSLFLILEIEGGGERETDPESETKRWRDRFVVPLIDALIG